MQNIPDDPVQALDLLVNDCGIFVFGGAWDESPFQTVQANVDGSERISDFMCHTGGQRPKRANFSCRSIMARLWTSCARSGAIFTRYTKLVAVNPKMSTRATKVIRSRCKPPNASCESSTNWFNAARSTAFSFAHRSSTCALFSTLSKTSLGEGTAP